MNSSIEIGLWVLVALVSLVVGSFLNVVIHRVPIMLEEDERDRTFNLCFPASHCPSCQHHLAWWHNIPLISFIFLRGRCGFCRTRIAWRYPLVELAAMVLALLLTWRFGFSWQMMFASLFSWWLIAMFVIDCDHLILPDSLTLSLLWLGLLVNAFGLYVGAQSAIIGAAAGYLVFAMVSEGYALVRGREGLGGGDWKLLAAIGAWLGWRSLPLLVVVAAVLALIIMLILMLFKRHRYDQAFPFGPFLVVAGVLLMVLHLNVV